MPETRGHLLIVDDTPENIQVLGGLLRDQGYAINVAMNGVDALASVARVAPELILLDVMMPGMDGFEVCRRLKADPATRDIPVMFLTAKTETEHVVEGFDLGAVDYVTKPFQAAELLRRVETHMTLARLREELQGKVAALSEALSTIEQINQEQDAFLRHELNNVINPIVGYLELLRSRMGDRLDEKELKWLQAIADGTNTMQDMLLELKRLQEIEREQSHLQTLEVQLYAILEDVIHDVEAAFGSRVRILLDPATLDARIRADLTFLPGALRNVIKNGVEHVLEHVTGEPPAVRVACASASETVTIEVWNAGPPVPDHLLERFFDKFNSTKTASGGTGLGTTFARIVTEAHGGSISVSSSAEDGTRVRMVLPRVVS